MATKTPTPAERRLKRHTKDEMPYIPREIIFEHIMPHCNLAILIFLQETLRFTKTKKKYLYDIFIQHMMKCHPKMIDYFHHKIPKVMMGRFAYLSQNIKVLKKYATKQDIVECLDNLAQWPTDKGLKYAMELCIPFSPSLLHSATEGGSLECVKFLVLYTQTTKNDLTLASRNAYPFPEILDFLLDTLSLDFYWNSWMRWECGVDPLKVLKKHNLLCVSINHLLADGDYVECLRYLIEEGREIAEHHLEYCMKAGLNKCLEVCLEFITPSKLSTLQTAIEFGYVDVAERILTTGIPWNGKVHPKCLDLLLGAGFNVEVKEEEPNEMETVD